MPISFIFLTEVYTNAEKYFTVKCFCLARSISKFNYDNGNNCQYKSDH